MDTTIECAAAAPLDGRSRLAAAMSPAEQSLLHAAAAAAGVGSALEFGCGGSTGLLVEAGVRRLLSVDSDAAWLDRVAADPRCAAAVAAGRLRLRHADIGATGEWGWPRDTTGLPLWPRYWRDPWDWAGEAVPDLVLVDGRFRVACALAGAARLGPGARLLIHDFWSREAYRAPVLRHFALEGSAGSLALLRPRRPADAAQLAVDLAAHALDPL
jgi:hypothetical protein